MQATIITGDKKSDIKRLARIKSFRTWLKARIKYARTTRLQPVRKYRFGIEKA